jgi:FixJ family two-component response regulator
MRRDEVVAALRQAQKDRKEISRLQARLAAFEKAWRSLTREEQEILHRTVVDHRKGQVEWLCGELGIEKSAVYRRRDKALQKLGERL